MFYEFQKDFQNSCSTGHLWRTASENDYDLVTGVTNSTEF